MWYRRSEKERKPQKREAYNRKHVRVSRTGGAAVTKICKKDGAGATLNTKQGLCLHTRLFQGTQMGFKTEIFNVLEFTITEAGSPFRSLCLQTEKRAVCERINSFFLKTNCCIGCLLFFE
jgi:hypothetical protein